MLNKVLVWVLMLTFVSGYANILSIFTVGMPTTHITGSLTNISYSLFELNFKKAGMLLLIVLLFLIGGIISGYIFSNRQFGKGKSYGVLLITVGIILIICEVICGYLLNIPFSRYIMVGIVAVVSGTQNGLNIMYNGMVIRTTHMTGYLSDIGKIIGSKISKKQIDKHKLEYLIMAVCIYFLGGMASMLISLPEMGHNYYEIAVMYILCGFFYLFFIYNKEDKRNCH